MVSSNSCSLPEDVYDALRMYAYGTDSLCGSPGVWVARMKLPRFDGHLHTGLEGPGEGSLDAGTTQGLSSRVQG